MASRPLSLIIEPATAAIAARYSPTNASAFGGGAEYIALWFKSVGVEAGFYVFMSATCAVGFITVLLMRETQANSTIVED